LPSSRNLRALRALVLAAGYGERLGPLTAECPKPMIDIGGRPILHYNLELLARAGIREIAINLHYRPDAIRDYFKDGLPHGVAITYVYEPELLGTAGALRNVADWLAGDDFFVIYGDNVSTIDLRKLIGVHREKDADLTIALYAREDRGSSGIAALDADDRITRFAEKPRADDIFSHWVNAGYLIAKPSVLDAIPARTPSDLGRDVFPQLLAGGARIYGYRMTEALWWIDSPADYEATKAAFDRKPDA
jgi:NDP-sugar pyrophosphorylase family protein